MSTDSSEVGRQEAATDSWRPARGVFALSIAAILICVSCLVWLTANRTLPNPVVDPPPEESEPNKGENGSQGENLQEPSASTIAPDELAVRENEHIAMERRISRLREKLSELRPIRQRLENMRSDSDGRKVAANPVSVEQFLAIEGLVRVGDIDDWQTKLEETQSDLRRSKAAGPKKRLSVEEKLRGLEDKMFDGAARFRKVARMLDVLVAELPEPSSESPALEEVIAQQKKEREAVHTKLQGEALRVTKEKVAAELEKFSTEIGDLKGKIGSLKKQDEAAAKAHQVKQEEIERQHLVKLREQQAASADLERRFEIAYPRFNAYLVPFTSTGYGQPHGWHYKRTTTKGPVSYGKLLGSGMLLENNGSLSWLYLSTASAANDRELGAFPPHDSWSFDKHRETLLTIQSFLREFGPVMVKKKILAP